MSFTLRSWLTAAAASLLVAGPAAHAAASSAASAQAQARIGAALARSGQATTPERLRQMPAGIRQAFLKARMAQQKAAATNDGLDHVPPTLTAIQTSPPVNTAGDNYMAKFKLQLADSYSGVSLVCIWITSPSGRNDNGTCNDTGLPTQKVSISLGIQPGTTEAGSWSVNQVAIWDAAGNVSMYDSQDLSAFGDLHFDIKSPVRYQDDTVAPAFISGLLLTPTLSLSSHPRGTTSDPYLGARFSVADQGSPRASGLKSFYAVFCLLNMSYCVDISHLDTVYRHAAETVIAGTQVLPGNLVPGEYQLYYTYVNDHFGNYHHDISTLFGGDTDMSTLFPAGATITLTE